MCTEAEPPRTLPNLTSAIPSLPAHLQRDAARLRDALSDAGNATEAASDYNSDTFDREEARALTRKVMLLYNKLTERAGPSHERIEESGNNTDNVEIADQPGALSHPPATPSLHEPSQDTHVSSSSTQTQSNSDGWARHIVPTVDDAFAPHLRDSANPVVRTFAPHVADLKYRVFTANHQRVWVGWSNWF